MGTLTSFRDVWSAQDGAPLENAIQEGVASTQQLSSQEPFFKGDNTASWVGFGAFVSIFLIVIIAIIRARVIKPAERMARETDFFEPAGANAEITFDPPAKSDADAKPSRKKDRKKKADKKSKRADLNREPLTDLFPADVPEGVQEGVDTLEEVIAEKVPEADPKMAEIAAAIDSAAADDKTASPFAGLFARSTDEKKGAATSEDGEQVLELVEAHDDTAAPDDVRIDHLPEIDQNYWDAERERRETAEYEQAEEDRRLALEEAAQARDNADAELRRRADAIAVDRRESERAQRKTDAVLEERMQAMSAMQGKLDAMADRLARDADGVETRISEVLEKKFEALSDDMHQRLHTAAIDIDARMQDAGDKASVKAQDGDAAAIASHVATLQKTMETALMGIAERIDALSDAQAADQARPEELRRLNALLAERAAPAVAGTLQLGDLVRAALPANRYAFDRQLESGAKADCVITRPDAAAFAIDARFPAEAFDRYARADEKTRDHAATAYRRAILRHMIFVAEKLIVPDETADFAILFVPNDTIFTDLHRNFADIVQDSYRARIWIASPTSLMATLHMMNAASKTDGDQEKGGDHALKSAVATLSARISALEDNLARINTASTETVSVNETAPAELDLVEGLPNDDASADDVEAGAPEDATEASTADMQEAEVAVVSADDEPTDGETADNAGDTARPPFPLR